MEKSSNLDNTTGNQAPWQVIAQYKRDDQANRLKSYADWRLGDLTPPPSQKNVAHLVHARLTDRERSFLISDVTDLVHRLATQECTAVEVATASCKATYAAHELTNCITEVMFTEALARARELDEHLSKTGRVVGPLHGIPVSIKDHICVKGVDTACGYVAWAGKNIAEKDSTLVHILRAAGAVIYVKSTNPQALLALETSSNIYGRTTNPFNRELAAGGSSGGAGVLVGSRANLLAVGTDSGGSIVSPGSLIYVSLGGTYVHIGVRVPAAWCGLYGLKPSSHRISLPFSGLSIPYKGKDDITLIAGPMTRSVRDLALFCQVVSDYRAWNFDPDMSSIPWNPALAQGGTCEKLVIGLWMDDGIVAPHPPIIERLQRAREALIAAGHEVIDWAPIDPMGASDLLTRYYLLDGGEDMRAPLRASGEPAIPLIEQLLIQGGELGACTLAESWATNLQRDQFREKALEHWNESALQTKSGRSIDAVLSPVAPTLASPHDTTRWTGYATYWNLLDCPAAAFPSGKPFNAEQWKSSGPHPPLGKSRNSMEEFIAGQWNPDTYDGAPVGLQLVGKRWQDERLIAHLKIVDALVNRSNAKL